MLVDYEKKTVEREFEFVKKVELVSKNGKKYSRMFWKNTDDDIATYIELNIKFNRNEIMDLREAINNEFLGWSFGKKCKENDEPVYVLEFEDEKQSYTYSELSAKIDTLRKSNAEFIRKEILQAPFRLGKNMYAQANKVVGKKHPTNDGGW